MPKIPALDRRVETDTDRPPIVEITVPDDHPLLQKMQRMVFADLYPMLRRGEWGPELVFVDVMNDEVFQETVRVEDGDLLKALVDLTGSVNDTAMMASRSASPADDEEVEA